MLSLCRNTIDSQNAESIQSRQELDDPPPITRRRFVGKIANADAPSNCCIFPINFERCNITAHTAWNFAWDREVSCGATFYVRCGFLSLANVI